MRKILLFLISYNFYIFCSNPTIISLGWDCEVAFRLREFGLRDQAFPFDWLQVASFNSIYKLIKNKFSYFLAKEFLIKKDLNVNNTYYNINFGHDFPTDVSDVCENMEIVPEGKIKDNFLDYLALVAEKYSKRIERLYGILNSKKTVIFIRSDNINPELAGDFVKKLEKKYPKLSFTLVCVHRIKELKNSWNIKRVKSFYVTNKVTEPALPASWINRNEWQNIFKELQLIKRIQT